MQRRWVRRLSPRVLVVALSSMAMVVTAVAVSQADPRSGRAVSVAMLSGGDAASLPGADMALPASVPAEAEAASPAPGSPPPTEPSTSTTAARVTAAPARATAAPAKPCPHTVSPDRPCDPPCPQPGSANSATACPPPCPQPTSAGTPGKCPPPQPPPPPTCRQYDPRTGASRPCPPPCSDTPDGSRSDCPPPPQPCPQDASCPEPCSYAQPAPAATRTISDPVPPSETCPPPCQGTEACPPPCPSAAPTDDQSCTPPCSYEPASSGPAAGAFAPCPAPSGVEGRVSAGPTCPVERADEPCADKPVETTLRLLRKDGSVAATGKSAPDGSFRLAVAPGSYRLVADWPSRIGGCGPVDITVEYGRFAHADVSCDTGIR